MQAIQKQLSALEKALREHSAMQGPAMQGGNLKSVLSSVEARLDARLTYMQHKMEGISNSFKSEQQEWQLQQPHVQRSANSSRLTACEARGSSSKRPACAKLSDYLYVPTDSIHPRLLDLDLYTELQEIMRCNDSKRSFAEIVGRPSDDAVSVRKQNWIQAVSCLLVVLNIVFMACSLHVGMEKVMEDPFEEPIWIRVGDAIFAALFAIELAVRLKTEGRDFFLAKWNVFDGVVMIFSMLEVVVDLFDKVGNVSWLRVLRMIRVFRAARILQFSSWFRECQLIIASLARGILPIFFVLLAVLFIMFVSALGMTQSVQGHLLHDRSLFDNQKLMEHYGSLWETMLTLFMAVSNGEQWSELLEPLKGLSGGAHLFFFLFYVVCVKFGILNILLAVIVTFVAYMRDCDEQAKLDAKAEQLQTAMSGLKRLLLDECHDGMITLKAFRKVITGTGSQFPTLLGLQSASMLSLFRLLDSSGCEQLNVNELMCGLMEIKHDPAHLQTAAAMYESQRILFRINGLSRYLESQFSRILGEEQT